MQGKKTWVAVEQHFAMHIANGVPEKSWVALSTSESTDLERPNLM